MSSSNFVLSSSNVRPQTWLPSVTSMIGLLHSSPHNSGNTANTGTSCTYRKNNMLVILPRQGEGDGFSWPWFLPLGISVDDRRIRRSLKIYSSGNLANPAFPHYKGGSKRGTWLVIPPPCPSVQDRLDISDLIVWSGSRLWYERRRGRKDTSTSSRQERSWKIKIMKSYVCFAFEACLLTSVIYLFLLPLVFELYSTGYVGELRMMADVASLMTVATVLYQGPHRSRAQILEQINVDY
jgi:hypothetical protein